MKSRVLILELSFYSDAELYADLVDRVKSKLNRPFQNGKQGRTSTSLIIETEEHPDSLLGRVFDIIDKDDVDDATVVEVVDAVGIDTIRNGPRWCNFTNSVKNALISVREKRDTKNVPSRKPRAEAFTSFSSRHSEEGAPVEVTRKRSRLRKTAG